MHIGFLGLGNMGGPMARNLLKAGHSLTVFDPFPQAVAALVEAGASAAASPAAVAQAKVEAIVTMLPSAAHVKQVYQGKDGLLAHIGQGVLLIDSSTIDPHSAREVAAAARKQGNPMLDAPVSGGTGGAAAGTLTFMVGGTPEAFARGKPVLEGMGKSIIHTGASGAGQAVKICNNMILAITITGVAEGFELGRKLGVDPQKIYDVVSVSTGRSWALNDYCPEPGIVAGAPSSKDYAAGFTAALMLKDLKLSQDAAAAVDAPTGLGAMATRFYQRAVDAGEAAKDFSVIRRWLGKQGRKDVVS